MARRAWISVQKRVALVENGRRIIALTPVSMLRRKWKVLNTLASVSLNVHQIPRPPRLSTSINL